MDAGKCPPLAPANTEEPDPAIAALYASAPSPDPQPEDYRERSANIWADPKLRELKNFTRSHKHQARLKDTAISDTHLLEDLYTHKALQSRLDWRNSMDKKLERLIVDMDLMHDKSVGDRCHSQRCEHLDKVFQWYERHGGKEARKEVAGPAYLTYGPDSPVMAGSLRVAPMEARRPRSRGMRSSSSAPSLLMATGLAAVRGDAALAGSRGMSPSSSLRLDTTALQTLSL